MLGGDEADNAIVLGAVGEAPRVAELGRDGQRGQVVDPAEAAQALDPGAQRLECEQGLRSASTARSRATASSTARRYARCVWSRAGMAHVRRATTSSCRFGIRQPHRMPLRHKRKPLASLLHEMSKIPLQPRGTGLVMGVGFASVCIGARGSPCAPQLS